MTHTEKILEEFRKWGIHQQGCHYSQRGKWIMVPCNMNCRNVFEGQFSTSIQQALAEERERVRGEKEATQKRLP